MTGIPGRPTLYVQVRCDLLRHRKFADLLDALGDVDEMAVFASLICLWSEVMERAPDGDISDWSLSAVARAAHWRGDKARWRASLVEAGFLEQQGGTITVASWADYSGKLFVQRAKDAERKSGARNGHVADSPAVSAGHPPDMARTSGGVPVDIRGKASRAESRDTYVEERVEIPEILAAASRAPAGAPARAPAREEDEPFLPDDWPDYEAGDVEPQEDLDQRHPTPAPDPVPVAAKKPGRERVTAADEVYIAGLVAEFTPQMGQVAAQLSIDKALNHRSLDRAKDKHQYLRNWIRGDAARVRPATVGHGQSVRERHAQEISEFRPSEVIV